MKKKNNDLERVISTIVLFPIAVLIICLGNRYLFNMAVAVLACLGTIEYYKAVEKICHPIKWVGYIYCVFIGIMAFIPNQFNAMLISISIPFLLLLYFMQAIFTNMKTNFKDIVYSFFGTIFIIFFFTFMCWIYSLENGKYLLWYSLIPAWGSDIFAYLIGKFFGKHKLTKVSPKKSVEGAVAGVVFATLLSLSYTFILNNFVHVNMNLNYIYISVMSAVLAVIGQIGDLSASIIKRYVDIKDFSEIIPGHGGILDRFDSVIFIAPFAFIFLKLMIIFLG